MKKEDIKMPLPDEELPLLFRDDLPETLTNDMLALAHLSDAEEEANDEEMTAGPVRRSRTRKASKPYGKSSKTEEEQWNDEMRELDFRTRAWKPFRKSGSEPEVKKNAN
jgi:hypothetical protein